MNYGWLTPASPDDVLQRVVLHEFGHALGLIHEHQNPKGAINWNRDAVIRDLSGPPNNWDLAKIEHNMFRKYEDVTATNADSTSIMMYPIPKAWTLDGFSAGLNGSLSQDDRDLIRSVYP
jgi:serralysin